MPKWSNPISLADDSNARRPRLLLVDDQPLLLRTLYPLFSSDHDVFMATSGPQALDFCQKNPPDLVLLDVEMPQMDGIEVSRQMKLSPELNGIPIIFVTGHSDTEAETRCWDAGGVDFITKPFNARTVQARVQVHLALKFQADLLRRMAFVDGLTLVANRRFFSDRLELEWRRCQRNHLALSLLMIDVDYFKSYNDHYGHQTGDTCLGQIATCLKHCLTRPFDLVARYGGEEFACLLPETGLDAAVALAHKMESAVRQLQIPHAVSSCAPVVTISIGVASAAPDPQFHAIPDQQQGMANFIKQADRCLYAAKHAGRGQVCA